MRASRPVMRAESKVGDTFAVGAYEITLSVPQTENASVDETRASGDGGRGAQDLVTFLQIVSQYCGGTINPPWPDLYTKVGQKFEVINLNFVSLAAATCGIKPDYSWKLWGMVSAPVLGMIGIAVFYIVSMARLRLAHEFEAREHDEAAVFALARWCRRCSLPAPPAAPVGFGRLATLPYAQ